MSKLPLLSGKELIKILQRIGFEVVRQKGSHVFLRHPGEEIDRGLLNKIIKKDLKMSREEFLKYLK